MTRYRQSPTVTIILPCYNLENHIAAAIRSVQGQDFTDFETLVIDDGSTDATAQAAEAAIAGDPRFRLIRAAHKGLSAARNIGLDAARGNLIAFLDGDDTYAPGFLRAHVGQLTQSGADWSACALRLVWPNGHAVDHSALHGTPLPEGEARWIDLTDARTVAQMFPSAWNKLYRRDLIEQTRFIDGALFEDHPFFWTLACKAGRIRYLPQPLYNYTRGRAGQITDLADRAMFQQLDRLREVAEIARDSPLSHVDDGLSRLATRVIHERVSLPAPQALSEQFLTDAAQLMADEGLHWDRAGARDISPHPAPRLDPEMRLSVLVLVPIGTDPTPTLHALAAQDLPIWDMRCIHDTGAGMIAALLSPLDSSRGRWIACLRAGDLPSPDWAANCLEVGRRHDAACIIASAQHGGGAMAYDTGFALPQTHLAAPDPAMLILHRRALSHLPAGLGTLPDPVAAACLCAHLAGRVQSVPATLLRTAPRPAPSLAALAQTLAQAPANLCPLTQDNRASVFAHLAQMRLAQGKARPERLSIAITAGIARWRAGLPPPVTGAHIGPYLRACLGRPKDQNKAGRSLK